MNARLPHFLALSTAFLFGVVSISSLVAQEKKADTARQNVQGTVQDINKDKSVITVQNGTKIQLVGYSSATKFLSGHSNDAKPGSVAQLKTSNYISCAAAMDAAKKQLMASECVYRDTK
jgi:hypothetical protein